MAITGSLLNALPLVFRWFLVTAIIVNWFVWTSKNAYRQKNPVSIGYTESEGWTWQFGTGEPVSAKLLGSSVATGCFLMLHFRLVGTQFRSVLLFPDSVDAEEYRRLRILLNRSKLQT